MENQELTTQTPAPPAPEVAVESATDLSRRDFLKVSAATAVVGAATFSALGTNYAWAQPAGRIKVGWIGCGGRGNGAIRQSLDAAPEMLLWAVGDIFDKAGGNRNGVKNDAKYKDKVNCPDERCFQGFDAYKHVIDSGVDMIVQTTPPGFRPIHIAYAIQQGKHVFAEKPFGVDAWGVQLVMDAAKMADEKKLSIVSGAQRRHQKSYIDTINHIKQGAIGDIVSGQCYWNQSSELWDRSNEWKPTMSDMEKQITNWYHYTWLCGDHVVEQHLHNLDVMNWVIGAHPDYAVGMGGRQSRLTPPGHAFDHFATELTYPSAINPNGIKVLSMARQQNNTESNVSEYVQGTKGAANPGGDILVYGQKDRWRPEGGGIDPYQQEHIDMIQGIKDGKPLNEGQRMAESTLTAIMCREACYTGKKITWNQLLGSGQRLFQANYEWSPLPTPPVARPGKTVVNRVDISQEMVDALKKQAAAPKPA